MGALLLMPPPFRESKWAQATVPIKSQVHTTKIESFTPTNFSGESNSYAPNHVWTQCEQEEGDG